MKCQSNKKNGERCSYNAKYGNYCGIHKIINESQRSPKRSPKRSPINSKTFNDINIRDLTSKISTYYNPDLEISVGKKYKISYESNIKSGNSKQEFNGIMVVSELEKKRSYPNSTTNFETFVLVRLDNQIPTASKDFCAMFLETSQSNQPNIYGLPKTTEICDFTLDNIKYEVKGVLAPKGSNFRDIFKNDPSKIGESSIWLPSGKKSSGKTYAKFTMTSADNIFR